MAIQDPILTASDAFLTNPFVLNVVTAILILLIGFIIGKIIGKIILKVLKEIEFDKNMKKTTGYGVSYSLIVSRFVSYFIYFIAVIMALDSLGLTPFVLKAVAIVILLIVGISILLAIKDSIPNFIAGISVRRKKLCEVGDRIKVGNIEGKVVEVNLLDTRLKTSNKDLIVVPNSYFMKNYVVKKNK